MAYDKQAMAKGTSMNSGKGMCSYSKNPLKQAKKVAPECGPGMNADQKHANKLLQQAQKQWDSQRGMSGM